MIYANNSGVLFFVKGILRKGEQTIIRGGKSEGGQWAQEYEQCLGCGAGLKDPLHRRIGMGPSCLGKSGWAITQYNHYFDPSYPPLTTSPVYGKPFRYTWPWGREVGACWVREEIVDGRLYVLVTEPVRNPGPSVAFASQSIATRYFYEKVVLGTDPSTIRWFEWFENGRSLFVEVLHIWVPGNDSRAGYFSTPTKWVPSLEHGIFGLTPAPNKKAR